MCDFIIVTLSDFLETYYSNSKQMDIVNNYLDLNNHFYSILLSIQCIQFIQCDIEMINIHLQNVCQLCIVLST